jgi:FAD/FMN-containing dehydrogenase
MPDKTRGWALEALRAQLDPGSLGHVLDVKKMLDPDGSMNPGRWSA